MNSWMLQPVSWPPAAALSLNTGTMSKSAVSISHLGTQTWENTVHKHRPQFLPLVRDTRSLPLIENVNYFRLKQADKLTMQWRTFFVYFCIETYRNKQKDMSIILLATHVCQFCNS